MYRLDAMVHEICADIYEDYMSKKKLKIVADRFHTAKASRDGAYQLHKEMQRDLQAGSHPEEEYERGKGTI
jgi:hypothetical protein